MFENYKDNFIKEASFKNPIIIKISNNGVKSNWASIFGFNKNFDLSNFGNGSDLNIEPVFEHLKYSEILAQSAFCPFETDWIVLRSKNKDQLFNAITIESKDYNGQSCTIPIFPKSYMKDEEPDYDEENGIYSVYIKTKILVNSTVNWYVSILPNTSLDISIYYNKIK